MSKSRNLADLLDGNGDVKASGLDNVPPSNDASALTTGTLSADRLGAGSIAAAKLANDAKVIKATTAPSSPSEGDLWFDTSTNVKQMFHWNGSDWKQMSNVVLDGSTAALAPEYGSDVVDALGSAFTPGLYWLTGDAAAGQAAQQVYVDANGWMLFYRHAGTGGSYNSTYEIVGDGLGEGAVGTLYSPTQGLTDTGSSTTAGSRGMARLATDFVRALGGSSASDNVYYYNVGGYENWITDAQWYATYSGTDGYGYDNSASHGYSYAGRRTYTGHAHDTGRPLCTYNSPGNNGTIPYYHGNTYSGGYSQASGTWHLSCTIWVRQY